MWVVLPVRMLGISKIAARAGCFYSDLPTRDKIDPVSRQCRDLFVIEPGHPATDDTAPLADQRRRSHTRMLNNKIRVALMWASMVMALVASSGIASANIGWA